MVFVSIALESVYPPRQNSITGDLKLELISFGSSGSNEVYFKFASMQNSVSLLRRYSRHS
ncbi:hypothetical protein KU70_09470 [Campylobacter fetus]|nr:hypothetical protein KU70_09470 [Campylobacter fetus]